MDTEKVIDKGESLIIKELIDNDSKQDGEIYNNSKKIEEQEEEIRWIKKRY